VPDHFGLAVDDYAHSTAPNRRFADLVTQRLVKAALAGRSSPYSVDELSTIATRCSLGQDSSSRCRRARAAGRRRTRSGSTRAGASRPHRSRQRIHRLRSRLAAACLPATAASAGSRGPQVHCHGVPKCARTTRNIPSHAFAFLQARGPRPDIPEVTARHVDLDPAAIRRLVT
jgi:hypothetical protein